MATNVNIVEAGSIGEATATAGTVITTVVPPKRGHRTRLVGLEYISAGTAHTVNIHRAVGKTVLNAAAAAAQADIVVKTSGSTTIGTGSVAGAVAANDFLVIEKPDGSYHVGKVSSVAAASGGTQTITLTANVPTGGFAAGAQVWLMGAVSESSNQILSPTTSATSTYGGDVFCSSFRANEPLLLQSTNATAAGTFRNVKYGYTRTGALDPNPSVPYYVNATIPVGEVG